MNISKLRKEMNKKQEEIAKCLNISRATFGNYEAGNTEPDIKTLIKIADYFNVSLDYLCERQWNNQIGHIPENKRELIQKVLELQDPSIKQADAYITALIDSNK